jgi:hypothetical protein
MVDLAPVERRRQARQATRLTSRVAHEQSGRSFACEVVDASANGARLLVPVTMPVSVGHHIHIDPGGTTPEKVPAWVGRDLNAKVVRVDRETLLEAGRITVGVLLVE